jgi:uncharacterized protein (TIRG00374 family)
MKRGNIALVIGIIAILIFYFLILPAINFAQFVESLKNVNLWIFSLALIAVTVSLIVASARWSLLMREMKGEKSHLFVNALGIFSIGQVAGLIVPSRVGNYAKVPLVTKLDNLPYAAGLSAVNAEAILDLAYICCAGIVSLFLLSTFFSTHPYLSTALIVLTVVLLAVAAVLVLLLRHIQEMNTRLVTISQDPGRTWFIRTPARILGKLVDLILSTKDIFRKKNLVMELGLTTILTQLFGVVGLYLVIGSTHATLPFAEVFALLTISYIIGIASLIPGGFGAADLSLIVLLGTEGIPIAVATNIAILWRVVMYLPIFVIIGVFFLRQKISGKNIIG